MEPFEEVEKLFRVRRQVTYIEETVIVGSSVEDIRQCLDDPEVYQDIDWSQIDVVNDDIVSIDEVPNE